MSPEFPKEKASELRELLFQRRKIEAIKLYRDHTGAGLKESKDAVEEIERMLLLESPQKFAPAPKQNGGCFTVIALLVVGALMVAYLLLR